MRLFVSTAILGAVAGMLAAAATPDRAIRALIDGGHWKQARAALEPRMKANPSDAEAASLLSRVRSAYGDLDGALALAESAVKVEPKNAEYRWQLAAIVGSLAQKAGVLKQIGLGRRFRQEAEQAIALDPISRAPTVTCGSTSRSNRSRDSRDLRRRTGVWARCSRSRAGRRRRSPSSSKRSA